MSSNAAGGSERLENVRIDYENNLIVIDDVGIQVQSSEGEPLDIDHASPMDGYVAFLESAENGGVRVGGDEATICFVDPGSDRS